MAKIVVTILAFFLITGAIVGASAEREVDRVFTVARCASKNSMTMLNELEARVSNEDTAMCHSFLSNIQKTGNSIDRIMIHSDLQPIMYSLVEDAANFVMDLLQVIEKFNIQSKSEIPESLPTALTCYINLFKVGQEVSDSDKTKEYANSMQTFTQTLLDGLPQ